MLPRCSAAPPMIWTRKRRWPSVRVAASRTTRVITSGGSAKARHVRAGQARVAVCQVDGRRWVTLEGTAVVREDAAAVADAERRYAQRYRQPRDNPARVVLEISVDRVLGNA